MRPVTAARDCGMARRGDLPVTEPTGLASLRLRRNAIALALLALALLLGVWSLATSDENAIAGLGLVDALPAIYYGSVVAIIAIVLLALRSKEQPTAVLAAGLVAIVVLVHGAAAILESAARFPVAWLHAGITDSILTTGTAAQNYDARFSWPGFFSGAAVLTDVTGVSSPTVFLRWAPIVMVLCYLPPLLSIGRSTLPGWRAPWLGVLIFLLADWVGQDYFAPQTVAVILYLTIIAIALRYLRGCEPRRLSRWIQRRASLPAPRGLGWVAGLIRAGDRQVEPPTQPTSTRFRAWLLVLLTLLSVAMVSSHQLTPVVLIVVLAALAALGRFRPWPFPFLVGVIMIGWLSYAAEPFWSGHLNEIFGGIGDAAQVVDSGSTDRVGGSPDHLFVLQIRMIMALSVWGLAGLGALRMWLSGKRVSVPLLVMTAGPGFLIATQSYGGEGLLRVFLFSLPGAAMLITGLVLPKPKLPSWTTLVLSFVASLLIFAMFLFARWGNEDFERVSAADVALQQEFYRVAPLGATLVTFSIGGPATYQNLTDYEYGSNLVADFPFKNIKAINTYVGTNPKGTYLLINQQAVADGVANQDLPPDSGELLVAQLIKSGDYQVVFKNESGVLLKQQIQKPAKAGAKP